MIVHATDPDPEKIVGYLTRRDEDSQSDWIHLFIDSYHDRRTGYQFAVNSAGVKRDAYWFNDDNNDDSWDAVWDVKVSRSADRDGARSSAFLIRSFVSATVRKGTSVLRWSATFRGSTRPRPGR